MSTVFSISQDDIISEFQRFLKWEQQSYEGWENVQVFIKNTLSEAWVSARPEDAYKFDDLSFKKMVDNANGKWLEKKAADDSYKIILSTRYCRSLHDLTKTFVHEMRHCLDYQNAVKGLPFENRYPGNRYYNNWSEFRAVYSHTRYDFFSKCAQEDDIQESFFSLAEILGRETADCVAGLMSSKNDLHDTLYFISRYIGASRAVQNLNMQLGIDVPALHLWHLTPQYIIENYGYVFYIGNEWDSTEVCSLNEVPKTYYYEELVSRIQIQGE